MVSPERPFSAWEARPRPPPATRRRAGRRSAPSRAPPSRAMRTPGGGAGVAAVPGLNAMTEWPVDGTPGNQERTIRGVGRRTRGSRGSPRLETRAPRGQEERYALPNPPCRGIPVRGCRPASRFLKAVVLSRLPSQVTGPLHGAIRTGDWRADADPPRKRQKTNGPQVAI